VTCDRDRPFSQLRNRGFELDCQATSVSLFQRPASRSSAARTAFGIVSATHASTDFCSLLTREADTSGPLPDCSELLSLCFVSLSFQVPSFSDRRPHLTDSSTSRTLNNNDHSLYIYTTNFKLFSFTSTTPDSTSPSRRHHQQRPQARRLPNNNTKLIPFIFRTTGL